MTDDSSIMHYLKKLFPQSIKNIYHLAQAILANVIFGFPSRKLKVIGITGTDGKTTTAQMTTKILQEAGKKVALASTINFVIDGVEEKNLSHFTTESAFALQKFIKKAVDAGCEYLVLETSSHSLDQYRVWGVQFQMAVITNVTREHLDYHGTMEKYREVKKKLFEMTAKNNGTIVVNLDMENPEEFFDFDVEKKFAYTCHPELVSGSILAERLMNLSSGSRVEPGMTIGNVEIVRAKNIELGIADSSYQIQDTRYQLHVPGLFNIENALAASCVALGEGIEEETIKEALAKIKGVAGRMERVENELGAHILVDFALTPNALERLYSTLAAAKKTEAPASTREDDRSSTRGGKIIAVFGSCGDRDKGKRPIMGEVVSKFADVVVLTNDEPYHENPLAIIDQIAAGIKNKTKNENLFLIEDRREAIRKALEIAKAGDIICITGMGNFESMVVGDKKIPWNDRQVIEEELKNIF